MKIYILIPVFNESSNIERLAANLIDGFKNYSTTFVFINDGSKDDSVKKLNQYFKESDYKIINYLENKGPGFCFNSGFEWIIKNSQNESDLIITMEADNTSDINLAESMIAFNKIGFDIVLASIYCQGGSFVKTSILRKFLSLIANIFLRFIFDIKVQTLSSFYRLYSIKSIIKIKDNYTKIISENGFICMVELLIKLIKQESKIIEIPMELDSSNRKGKSKMKLIKTSLYYIKFIFFNKLK